MTVKICTEVKKLARSLTEPLYAVGGYVRNCIINGTVSGDLDLSSPLSCEEFCRAVNLAGLNIVAKYKRTGTVVFQCNGTRCEFTSFRTESYSVGGTHCPETVRHTNDILKDAVRRDFTCNAVYYDILKKEIVDPLNGVRDIKERVLKTVKAPEEVFSSDGLRLLRLARFAGELNFSVPEELIVAARKNKGNIKDVSAERIYDELKKILVCDTKYSFSDKEGHYRALKILDKTRVLDNIIPELTDGRGIYCGKEERGQDLLEDGLKSVLYAPPSVRLAALLYEAEKIYAYKKRGNFTSIKTQNFKICDKILKRIKPEKNTAETCVFLIESVNKIALIKAGSAKSRVFISENYDKIFDILSLFAACYSAEKGVKTGRDEVGKWYGLIDEMKKENAPFSYSELAVNGREIAALGYRGKQIGKVLKALYHRVAITPSLNTPEKLKNIIQNLRIPLVDNKQKKVYNK